VFISLYFSLILLVIQQGDGFITYAAIASGI